MCRACAKAQQKTHTHSTPPKKINNVLNVDDLKKKESSKNLLFDLSSSFQVSRYSSKPQGRQTLSDVVVHLEDMYVP